MAAYSYYCEKCDSVFDKDFDFGKAPNNVKCDRCNTDCKRSYDSCSFVLKGGGWPGKSMKFNKEQTDKNINAGIRQKDRKPPVRLKALDYGNGDVREVN